MGIAAKGIRSAAAAALLLAVAPAGAQAGTVSAGVRSEASGQVQQLEYAAVAGERNRLTVTLGRGSWTVEDSAGVTPGPGCTAESPTRATCPVQGTTQDRPSISLGDLDDQATVVETGAVVRGEAGNDLLTGGSGDDGLVGGPGTDVLAGGGGGDALDGGGGAASRERTADRLDGGAGSDDLIGTSGPNRLTGGTGVDDLRAGAGNDRIAARDRFVDRVRCGTGRDTALLDGLDWFRRGCARVLRSGPAGATLLEIRARDTGARTALLQVACPGDVAGCRGRVRLRAGGRSTRARGFRIRRGGTRRVALSVPAGARRELASGGGGRVTVVLYSRSGRRTRTVILREFMPVPSVTPGS